MAINVLVVEDEAKVQKFVRSALEQAGNQVECAGTLVEMEQYLERSPFDVVVLDRLLGKEDSLRFVGKIKKNFPHSKILFLSALSDVDQRIAGIDAGADDYLAKPFHVAELVTRVRALARRESAPQKNINTLTLKSLSINLESQEVKQDGKTIELSAKEFKLLTLLVRHPAKVFSKNELLDRVWGLNADPGSNVVEVTIKRLRAKVDKNKNTPLIRTRRGVGYWCTSDSQDE
jgi:two-component system OmpR family response regulator